jgi:iodotyrosine deiodinase
MTSQKNNYYEPISLTDFQFKSESEMETISNNHLLEMTSRHTIRDFSNKDVPFSIIKNCIKVACSAPSGANLQPWHFSLISSKLVKSKIREAAEIEEQKFYNDIKKDEWLKALEPIGTHADKPHLEVAPWLIVVFSERYSELQNGQKRKNYYVPESVGIATGFLITALHLSGLSCLTHTPNPMGFLSKICNRPSSNKASLILAVGYPEENAKIPLASTIKKSFDEVVSVF